MFYLPHTLWKLPKEEIVAKIRSVWNTATRPEAFMSSVILVLLLVVPESLIIAKCKKKLNIKRPETEK